MFRNFFFPDKWNTTCFHLIRFNLIDLECVYLKLLRREFLNADKSRSCLFLTLQFNVFLFVPVPSTIRDPTTTHGGELNQKQ